MSERNRRWRLILGEDGANVNESKNLLSETDRGRDKALQALYDSDRKGGLGPSSPNINRWLGDIRTYFPQSVVQVMQRDAMDRLGLTQMLLEPESLAAVEPDVHLVATLLTLSKAIPDKTYLTARKVVQKVVEDLQKRLDAPMRQAVNGSLSRGVRNFRPKLGEIDWNATIAANLQHYQEEYNTVIPEKLVGFGRKGQGIKRVILCLDQSGSMASSVIYSAVFGATLASIKSLNTQVILFDTSVVDLTAKLHDPVELLFSVQLGGGTHIQQALTYCQSLVVSPADTVMVLISDLIEGGNDEQFLAKAAEIHSTGANLICLLALSDEGAPMFNANNAAWLAAKDIPCFACTPDAFPNLMAKALKRQPIGTADGGK